MSITHKTTKTRKKRASRTYGWGGGKKHRGAGSRGGRGKAGSGKRGQQRETKYLAKHIKMVGKHGFKSHIKRLKIINVSEISKLAKNNEVDITNYKLLGSGNISEKLKVKVKQYTKKAEEKIKAAGGEIV